MKRRNPSMPDQQLVSTEQGLPATRSISSLAAGRRRNVFLDSPFQRTLGDYWRANDHLRLAWNRTNNGGDATDACVKGAQGIFRSSALAVFCFISRVRGRVCSDYSMDNYSIKRQRRLT
jgi:hypothetical protein